MPADDYIDYLLELLSALGSVTARRMFGGYGLYHDGLMVAIVVEQRLYLKVDDETRATFVAAGCEAWIYDGKGKPVQTSYWSVPDEAMDSADAMTPWARRAFAAALRKANAKPLAKAKRATVSPGIATAKKAPVAAKPAVKKAPVAAKQTTKKSASKKPAAAKQAKPASGTAKPQR